MPSLDNIIPYGKHFLDDADVNAVMTVLQSGQLTQGPRVPDLESRLAEYVKAPGARVVNSATSALLVALKGLGIGLGDTVWVPAISFVATANVVIQAGAKVDFLDIDDQLNLDVAKLAERLSNVTAEETPDCLIVVHMAGVPAKMEQILELSIKYQFKVIEDASHALGAKYNSTAVGSCAHSDAAIFSFHPVKSITAGEGGCITSRNLEFLETCGVVAEHGIKRPESLEDIVQEDEIWHFKQESMGYNFRMPEVCAALCISQLCKLPSFLKRRREIAARYCAEITNPLFEIVHNPDILEGRGIDSSFHLFVVRVKKNEKWDQAKVFAQFRQLGVLVSLHYAPIYLHPFYKNAGWANGICPQAESYFREGLSLPIYYELTEGQQSMVIDLINRKFI